MTHLEERPGIMHCHWLGVVDCCLPTGHGGAAQIRSKQGAVHIAALVSGWCSKVGDYVSEQQMYLKGLHNKQQSKGAVAS